MQQDVSLLFVVTPPSVEVIQFWAEYARSAFTLPAFQVVSHRYNVFWHETSMYESYVEVQRCVTQGDIALAVLWADSIMLSIYYTVDNVQVILSLMDRKPEGCFTHEGYQRVRTQMNALLGLQIMVAKQVVQWCTQQSIQLPQYTQQFFEAQH